MGGGKYTDVHVFDAEQEGLIHSLCTDARLEVEAAEEYIKTFAVLIGKLYSDCKDFMIFQKCESDTIISGLISYFNLDADFEADLLPDLKELTDGVIKMVMLAKLCDEKGKKLKKRCLKEIKIINLAITDAINENVDEEEIFELYGVMPDFITCYVIPKLYLIDEMTSSTITYNDQILCHFQERLRLVERRIKLVKERDSLTILIKEFQIETKHQCISRLKKH